MRGHGFELCFVFRSRQYEMKTCKLAEWDKKDCQTKWTVKQRIIENKDLRTNFVSRFFCHCHNDIRNVYLLVLSKATG